jgi:hypothetical protein
LREPAIRRIPECDTKRLSRSKVTVAGYQNVAQQNLT